MNSLSKLENVDTILFALELSSDIKGFTVIEIIETLWKYTARWEL